MKHKSKIKNKINKHKMQEKKRGIPQVPAEWLYLTPAETTLRRIYELFGEDTVWNAEYWEEAGALEISAPEAGSVDMECMDDDFLDEEYAEYAEKCGAKAMFAVTIAPEDYERAQAVMRKIIKELGGFFCADTEDFLPEVRVRES